MLSNLFYGEKLKTCVRIKGRCLYGCEDEKQCEEGIMVCIELKIKEQHPFRLLLITKPNFYLHVLRQI